MLTKLHFQDHHWKSLMKRGPADEGAQDGEKVEG